MNGRVTRVEFLAELARRGHTRLPRWHEDWIEKGLIDRGELTNVAGRPGAFTWTAVQVEHAHALLCQVDRGAKLGALANYVAWTWLWYGDSWISFRQVSSAMRTWTKAERQAAVVNVRASAKDLVARIKHPRGSGKRRLVRALVDFHPSADPESLREPFDAVFDPDGTGRPRGPKGAELTTDSYLRLIALRQRALQRMPQFTEVEYRRAAALYINSHQEYAREQPGYARDPDLGQMHPALDAEALLNSACQDLLTCLGMVTEPSPGRASG